MEILGVNHRRKQNLFSAYAPLGFFSFSPQHTGHEEGRSFPFFSIRFVCGDICQWFVSGVCNFMEYFIVFQWIPMQKNITDCHTRGQGELASRLVRHAKSVSRLMRWWCRCLDWMLKHKPKSETSYLSVHAVGF